MSTLGAMRPTDQINLHRTFLRALTLCLSFSFGLNILPALAKKTAEEVYSVRYSYERLSKVSPQGIVKRYVLMPQPISIPLDTYQVPKSRYRAHFDALKDHKSSNYGKTGFNTSKDNDHIVQIFLDEAKEVNHPFLMAELIYTMIDAGAKHVEFPKSKYKGRPYTKADVSYSAYQLTLPYWEGLPPQELNGGLLSFPDGTLVTTQLLAEMLKNKHKKLLNQIVKSLKQGDLDTMTAIVHATEALKPQKIILEDLAKGFIPLLSAASKEIRLLALRGLNGIDQSDVNLKLREVMDEDPEADVQAKASELLSLSKDPKFAESAQFFALRSQSKEAIITAAKGLATAKNKEATTKLLEALSHESADIRAELIKSLLVRKAQKALAQALTGTLSLPAKVDIASSLITESDKKIKQEAYEYLARQPDGKAAAVAADALVQEKKFAPTLSLLAELCKHPEASARIAALKALRSIGGNDALKAATQANIQDEKTGAFAHETMRLILSNLKTPVVLKMAQSESDLALKSAAAGTLGVLYQKDKKQQKKIFSVLKELRSSSEALVRSELARSFGDVKTDEGKAELIELSKESEMEVKRLVAFAWRNYDDESARDILNQNLNEKDVPLLVNSLDSLGILNSVKSLSKIRVETFLKHENVLIRRATVGALAALAPSLEGKARAGVVSYVSPMIKDPDLEVQLRVVKTLGASPNEDAEFALAAHFESGTPELTIAIIEALVQHQSESAIKSLNAVIEINHIPIRQKLYSIATLLKTAQLKSAYKDVLEKALKREENQELKSLLEKELKAL